MSSLPDLAQVKANLAFTCAQEADHLPPLDAQADQLFQYARYLQTRSGPKDFDDMARYYRIAAAYDHYKANHNLQLLISQGMASSPYPAKESIGLAIRLVKADIPSGYYDIGTYLKAGYGLKEDQEMALRYFRKAADLGNPDAQSYVAGLLAPIDNAPDVARQMRRCAADQGHGDAANWLGIDLKNDKLYADAVKAFQKAVGAGNSLSALALEEGFRSPPLTEGLYYLALPNDPERSRRYELIGKFLYRNERRNPKVPDIDRIVPLPPAPLPAWDGTFQWQKERDATSPPAQPSEELIERLSKAKSLDPATGLPIPPAPKATLGSRAQTGLPCPETGQWCARLADGTYDPKRMNFTKGALLPTYAMYGDAA